MRKPTKKKIYQADVEIKVTARIDIEEATSRAEAEEFLKKCYPLSQDLEMRVISCDMEVCDIQEVEE